ncbi:hypothetical protein [Geomicrobium sp. JCM 19039]|uniref:hypothetical protein n=1 Tax=Geomicrobium sp. JCM 19039 TaxID=1460636 RepID=UPI000B129F6D|nr:hypothetical protein [Geomicrobium sp. JCM 19039]
MSKKKEWVLNIVGVVIVALFLFPVYWMVITAFKTQTEVFQTPPTFFPVNFQFESFVNIFSSGVGGYFLNSVIIASGATLLVLLLAVPSAYGLARLRVRGKKR